VSLHRYAQLRTDRERIQKRLFTSHPKSTPVTLKTFSTPVIEASFIATEIKRLIAYSGGVLTYGDFAILCEQSHLRVKGTADLKVRYNALSRVIESALQKDSIPNRIVGGHKFFERMEIKDLLAYLQLAENPGFTVRDGARNEFDEKLTGSLLSCVSSTYQSEP
jgi:DNA helicase-2/ATP-dependent DNA helicase PcrA